MFALDNGYSHRYISRVNHTAVMAKIYKSAPEDTIIQYKTSILENSTPRIRWLTDATESYNIQGREIPVVFGYSDGQFGVYGEEERVINHGAEYEASRQKIIGDPINKQVAKLFGGDRNFNRRKG